MTDIAPQLQSTSPSLAYRSDIEGMRAVAIILVVAAHAKVPWLAGGFVGVDVFFVLSGYLITGILLQEIKATGTISLSTFYARRFRRLLPALALMIACVGTLAALLLTPDEQPRQATAAASAAVWLSNFYFAFSQLGYFSPGAGQNLFLHTWSLGVEEQFYVIWPILLALAMGLWAGAKRQSHAGRLGITLLLVLGSSLALCLFWTRTAPHLAFYMMPTRAWQFALGALVVLYCGGLAGEPKCFGGGTRGRSVGWMGLFLVVASAVWLDADVSYPGAWALVPSIGTALLLAAGAGSTKTGVGNLLSLRPMQAIGRVSYSWYLWHWPILLLGAILVDVPSGAQRFGLVLFSFLLAVLTYRFVEAPIRGSGRVKMQPRMVVLSALAVMVVVNVLAIRWHNEATDRMTRPDQLIHLKARSDAPLIYGMGCDDWYRSAGVRICAFGPEDARHTAVAIGDSIGLQWFPAIAEVFNKPHWRLLVLTKSACPMVDEPIFYTRIGRDYSECTQWRQDALAQVVGLHPDVVILGSSSTYDFSRSQWISGTTRVLKSISDAVGNIYILRATPTLPFDGPSCLAPRSWLFAALTSENRCTAPAQNAQGNDVYRWLQTSADRFRNVSVIDMNDVVCPQGRCRAEQGGLIVFRDSQHLSNDFAQSLGPSLESRIFPVPNL